MKMVKLILLSLVAFGLLNALFSTFDVSDGYSMIGFPFRYLKYTSGKCDGCDNWFKPGYLILDYLLILVVCAIGWQIVSRKRALIK